jgi:hypothetical protein
MRNNEKRGRDEEKKEREEGRCDDGGKTERKSKNLKEEQRRNSVDGKRLNGKGKGGGRLGQI